MVIKFDLSNLPEGASVTEATLELYQYEWDGEAPPHTISAYRLTRAWVEGTGTAQFQSDHLGVSWEEAANGTAWTTPGGDYDTATDFGNGANGVIDSVALTSTDGAWQAWDVTPIVEAWAAGTLENHGLILISVAGDWSEHYFRSADHGTAATRPRLGVTYSSGSGSDDHPRLVMNNFNAASEVQLTLHQLETGRNCEIQAASNLVAGGWSVLHTFTATGSVHFWTDDGLANVTSRYYRFRQP